MGKNIDLKIETTNSDYIWSYAAYILRFGVTLFIFPLVLALLSSDEYGLWVTFSSFSTITNLFDFGFSTTLLRHVTYIWCGAETLNREGICTSTNTSRNDKAFITILRICKYIYLIVGLLAFIFCGIFGTCYIRYVIRDIYHTKYMIAWVIYASSTCFNLYFGYWSVLLKGIGAIKQTQKATVYGYLIQLILSYLGLFLGLGIVSLAISSLISSMSIRIISRFYFIRYQDISSALSKNYVLTKEELFKAFRAIWFNAKKAGISTIATTLISQSTTVIISAYLGLTVSAEFGLCVQILYMLLAISQISYQTSVPAMVEFRQHNYMDLLQKKFSLCVFIAWSIYIIGVLIFASLGNFALTLIGSNTKFDVVLFVALAIVIFFEMNYSMHATLISMENTLPFVPSVIKSSIIMIILTFLSISADFGIWGVVGARFLSQAIYIFWKWPLVAHKILSLNTLGIIKLASHQLAFKFKRIH